MAVIHRGINIKLPPLYKYLDVNGARLTLKNQTFKHSKPSDFTDKEDMTAISAFTDDIKTACIKMQNSIADCLANNVSRQCQPIVTDLMQATLLADMLYLYSSLSPIANQNALLQH